MFAISVDIEATVEQVEELRILMQRHGFVQQTGGFFLSESNDMTSLFYAINALEATPWFAQSVRDMKAFRVENWSDFTPSIKRKIK